MPCSGRTATSSTWTPPSDSVRQRQEEIRQLTLKLIDQQRDTPGGIRGVLGPLTELANGLMLQATQLLAKQDAAALDHLVRKKVILEVMDKIIARLEEINGSVRKSIATAEKAFAVLQKLSPEDRERALQRIRDLVQKLRNFVPEQDKVINDTQELVRKADDLTDKDLRTLEQTQGTEDKWDKVFKGAVSDISKLTDQNLADRSIANDYKEMVEQIDGAGKKLEHPKGVEMAVPMEQIGDILYGIHCNGVLRYGELKRSITGITAKMLTQTLRELENDKLVYRKVYVEVPPKVEYTLTPSGQKLIPFIEYLKDWVVELVSSDPGHELHHF